MVVGIFESMRQTTSDLVGTGKVIVTTSPLWSGLERYTGDCLVNGRLDCEFVTQNIENAYAIIRIVENPQSIAGIKLISLDQDYYPLSWALQGSTDGVYYSPIFTSPEPLCDEYMNDTRHVCIGQITKIYNIKKTPKYEYFKISQIGTNTALGATR